MSDIIIDNPAILLELSKKMQDFKSVFNSLISDRKTAVQNIFKDLEGMKFSFEQELKQIKQELHQLKQQQNNPSSNQNNFESKKELEDKLKELETKIKYCDRFSSNLKGFTSSLNLDSKEKELLSVLEKYPKGISSLNQLYGVMNEYLSYCNDNFQSNSGLHSGFSSGFGNGIQQSNNNNSGHYGETFHIRKSAGAVNNTNLSTWENEAKRNANKSISIEISPSDISFCESNGYQVVRSGNEMFAHKNIN